MNINVLIAVFKRNFINYFANPTGYVFICVFLLLSSIAAFQPSVFFSANLCDLDALNNWISMILLFFVPAITMGVWADESRQGTDELLLTIPAGDLEIVLGKYLACVGIYTVALIFSAVSNYLFLHYLGNPDKGLFAANYLGYWFLGLSMLSIGMVASFLTRNLTVAYIVGALLNALVVLGFYADMVPLMYPYVTVSHFWHWPFLTFHSGIATASYSTAMDIKHWSLGGQFQEFGRGIINLSGVVFFLTIAAIMLYLCKVLIGRRHWVRGVSWLVMGAQFIVRAAAMGAMAVGLVYIFENHPLRHDATSEQLSTLAPDTVKVIGDLNAEYQKAAEKRPVRIEAFVSTKVPEAYLLTRSNLRSTLRELQARAGDMIEVQIHDTEPTGPMADRAKERYGIEPKRVRNVVRGELRSDPLFLAVAVTSGLDRVVLPFIDQGTPLECDLVEAICTVTNQKRKRLGVVKTDAEVLGGIGMQGTTPAWHFIDDLKRQYDVIEVNPAQPIPLRKPAAKPGDKEEGYDVLLVVQPSAMGPKETENLIAAIRAGQPAVLFEDPFPYSVPVPGTGEPRRPADQMQAMFMQQNLQKGNLTPLWSMLGIALGGSEGGDEFQPMADETGVGGSYQVVFQNYNPYPKVPEFSRPEFVFIEKSCGDKNFDPYSAKDPISSPATSGTASSSGLPQLAFPFPGCIEKRKTSKLLDYDFEPLVRTSTNSGTVPISQMFIRTSSGRRPNPDPPHKVDKTEHILAAHITGRLPGAAIPAADKDPKAKPEKVPDAEVNVVVVSDIDLLADWLYELRDQHEIPELGLKFVWDNTALVFNAIDSLAKEGRFLALRKRHPQHRTLTAIDERNQESSQEKAEAVENLRKERVDNVKKETDKLAEELKKLNDQLNDPATNIEPAEVGQRLANAAVGGQKRLDDRKKELENDYNVKIDEINNSLDDKLQRLQGTYTLSAVLIPPIPLLVLAGLVFMVRRFREREGVSKERLR